MSKLCDLEKAILNRDFDHDEIEGDIEFVEKEFDSFRKYFNAVYEDVCAGESARVFLSSGRWTTEQYQDKIEALDKGRRIAHDRAVDACKIINRMCDMHEMEHICPDEYDRNTVADYAGNVMQTYYQQGLANQRVKDAQTSVDKAFENAKAEDRNPAEAYKKIDLKKEELEF